MDLPNPVARKHELKKKLRKARERIAELEAQVKRLTTRSSPSSPGGADESRDHYHQPFTTNPQSHERSEV